MFLDPGTGLHAPAHAELADQTNGECSLPRGYATRACVGSAPVRCYDAVAGSAPCTRGAIRFSSTEGEEIPVKRQTRLAVLGVVMLSLLGAFLPPASAADASPSPVIDRILKRKALLVGTAGNMPPLNMTTREGKVIGLEAELAKMMADAMGVQLKLKKIPFGDLLGVLQAGEVDLVLSGMTITPERNLKVAFAGPYMVSGKCFLTKVPEIASAKDPADIKRPLAVAALKGSTSQHFVEQFLPSAKLVTTTDYDEGVDLVLRGQVDAMVADYSLCAVSLIRYPRAGLASTFTRLTYEPLGIALPAGDPLLLNWVDNLMRMLEQTGRLQALEKRWMEDGWWLKLLP